MVGMSCHQCRDEGGQESFAAAPGIVHELKEAEIQRQLLLRDTPVRAEPGARQGPRPLHGVDVDLAEAVAILVARIRSVMLMPSSARVRYETKMIGFA